MPPRKPAAKNPAAKPARAARSTKSRRRTPYELVQELKTRREQLAQSLSVRIAKFDERIAQLEARHEARIAISQLMVTRTHEELLREEAEIKSKLSILKKARKLSSGK
jgi:hypothetical protein